MTMLMPAEAISELDADQLLFSKIASDIYQTGFSINANAIPAELAEALYQHANAMNQVQYDRAGIGRDSDFDVNNSIRTDAICWINGDSTAGQQWLDWCTKLQRFINQQLFLGLFSFESHFARYQAGDFYKRHLDAFVGEKNRILTLVAYLNKDWQDSDGGELVLYQNEQDQQGIKVLPHLGTLAVFLSEEFPHEVLPANRERLSIAGWFRINCSVGNQIDPPK